MANRVGRGNKKAVGEQRNNAGEVGGTPRSAAQANESQRQNLEDTLMPDLGDQAADSSVIDSRRYVADKAQKNVAEKKTHVGEDGGTAETDSKLIESQTQNLEDTLMPDIGDQAANSPVNHPHPPTEVGKVGAEHPWIQKLFGLQMLSSSTLPIGTQNGWDIRFRQIGRKPDVGAEGLVNDTPYSAERGWKDEVPGNAGPSGVRSMRTGQERPGQPRPNGRGRKRPYVVTEAYSRAPLPFQIIQHQSAWRPREDPQTKPPPPPPPPPPPQPGAPSLPGLEVLTRIRETRIQQLSGDEQGHVKTNSTILRWRTDGGNLRTTPHVRCCWVSE